MANNLGAFPPPQNGYICVLNMEKFERKDLITRHGSTLDVKKIEDCFHGLGNFKVQTTADFTLEKLSTQLANFCSVIKKNNGDFGGVFVMTHGDTKSSLCASNGRFHFKRDVMHKVYSNLHSDKIDIPLVFFVIACRGTNQWTMEPIDQEYDDCPSSQRKLYPRYKNVHVFYATTEGYVSKRNGKSGCELVTILCKQLEDLSQKLHLADIFTAVTGQFGKEGRPQIPEYRALGVGKLVFLTKEAKQKWSQDNIGRLRPRNSASLPSLSVSAVTSSDSFHPNLMDILEKFMDLIHTLR